MIADQSHESQIWALMGDIAQAVKNKLRPSQPRCRCQAHPCPHDPIPGVTTRHDPAEAPIEPIVCTHGNVATGPCAECARQVRAIREADESEPRCDICNELQDCGIDGWGDDWNGDTGCHRSCEDAMV